jgi:NAD(P)-dependent dehydrogenase (short-subunit alcohol dehydrogenase family)
VQIDVTDYDSVLRLFDTAWKKYGRVDVAISNAGIQEVGNLFDPGLDLESIKIVNSLLLFSSAPSFQVEKKRKTEELTRGFRNRLTKSST